MKIYLTTILIVLLFLLNLFLVYKISHFSQDEESLVSDYNQISNKLNNKYESLVSKYIKLGGGIKMTLNLEWRFINEVGDTLKLKDFVNPKKKYLVCCFNQDNCSLCVENAIQSLTKLSEKRKDIEIILWPYFQSYRDLVVFKKNSQTIYNAYMPYFEKKESHFENFETPLFFCIEYGTKATLFFSPTQEDAQKLLDDYISFVTNSQFKDN